MRSNPIPLYPHRTDGGAEYLTDQSVVCPNGKKEGVFEGATVIVRLDGSPEATIITPAAYRQVVEALKVMVDRFGVLEDNPMLHQETIQVSKQAKRALALAQQETRD